MTSTARRDLLDLPIKILNDLAAGSAIQDLAENLCRLAEAHVPGYIASIMQVGEDGHLHVLAAPSAPQKLREALDDLAPGTAAGSCGSAVFARKPSLVRDVAHDPRWDDLRSTAQAWNLHSCWSWPIWRADRIVGTFALTGMQPGELDDQTLHLLEFAASLAGTLLGVYALQKQASEASVLQQTMLDNSLVAIALVRKRVIVSANRRMAEMYGYRDAQALAGLPAEIVYPSHEIYEQMGAVFYPAMQRGEDVKQELLMRRADGSLFWCELSGRSVRNGHQDFDSVWVGQDISERHTTNARLQWQARHDALTKLPNRFAFDEWLPPSIEQARHSGEQIAVCMLDLDDFKAINDAWGHLTGDAVLQEFAENLRAGLTTSDFLARTGGDEFVLVLQGLHTAADAPRRLDALSCALPPRVALPHGESAVLGMSLGLALYPLDGTDADTLLRRADAALHSSKLHKADRRQWWLRWGQEVDAEFINESLDDVHEAPYGTAAARLLGLARQQSTQQVQRLVEQFYETVGRDAESAKILSHFSTTEFLHLKARQAEHLHRLLSPDLDEGEHLAEARRIGQVHALVGVPTRALVQSAGVYSMGLNDLVGALRCRSQDRRELSRLLSTRLQLELQAEVEAAQELRLHYQHFVLSLESALQNGTTWTEFMQNALDRIVALPGMKATGLGAPDASGGFIVEMSSGLEAYTDAMRRHYGTVRMPRVQHASVESLGPTATAWQSERISTLASYALADAAAPWRDAALEVGIRSAASIPLRDRSEHVVAVLSLYGAYPGMFERTAARSFLETLAQTLSRAWQRLHAPARGKPVPIGERQRWRQALFDHGLVMHVQPLVDLRTGKPYKVEALARLRLADGRMVAPGQFLPWFGRAELTRLFLSGLAQSLDAVAEWDVQGLRLNLGLNLPLDVMVLPECGAWLQAALDARSITPDRLYLEILEGGEFDDPQQRDDAVHKLAALGVRLSMDDLGSGYSSLLRLRNLPFHSVKIDQGLVCEAHRDPERVIGFVGALVQLAQSLGMWVVVEGLETPDLVEAATILGADAGQGYELARPMPASAMVDWVRDFRCNVDPQSPSTQLGIMALDWMQRQRSVSANLSERVIARTRGKARSGN